MARSTLRLFAFTPDDLPDARAEVERAVTRATDALDGIALTVSGVASAPPGGEGVAVAYREAVLDADVAVIVLWCHFGPVADAIVTLAEARAEAGRPTLYCLCGRPMPLDDDAAFDGFGHVRRLRRRLAEAGRAALPFDADLARPLAQHLIPIARQAARGDVRPSGPGLGPYLLYLAKQHAFMDIPGLAGNDHARPPLDDLYVRLRFAERAGRHLEAGALSGRRGRLADVLPRSPLAITGAPGAGKTTILRYVALRLARHHLDKDPAAPAELGLSDAPRPILFDLKALTDTLRDRGWAGRDALDHGQWAALIAERVGLGGRLRLSEADARRLLDAGGLLLMFDGLDEVSGERARVRHARRLGHLANTVCAARNHIIVTCRTRAWGLAPAFGRFDRAPVEPLDRAGIADFVGKWCRALGDTRLDRAAMTRELTASAAVRRIATNPQMLTMLAVLYTGRKRLPQQRARLYQDAVRWLLERRPEHYAAYGTTAEVEDDLRALAWRMQLGADGRGRRRDGVELGDALDVLGARQGLDRAAAADYLRALEQAVGLVLREDDRVRFHHRTFQEYLVARALVAGADYDPAQALGDRAGDPAWVEVVRLTAGALRDLGETKVRRFLSGLVAGDDPVERRAPRIGAAAACLDDLEAWGIGPETRAPVEAALAEVMPTLDDHRGDFATRLVIAEGLGRTRDPRLTPAKRWVEVEAMDAVWDGVAPGDEPDEWSAPGQWHPGPGPFFIQRWPVTVEDFEQFVDDGGYDDPELWSAEGWRWRVERGIDAPGAWDKQGSVGRNRPVTEVSWYAARAWCRWLTMHPGRLPNVPGVHFEARLPTALEWAAAARPAGARWRFPWGDVFDEAAANLGQRVGHPTPVGLYPADRRGLWDMAGNVWAWCLDTEVRARVLRARVLRGGGWFLEPGFLRVSNRGAGLPDRRFDDVGFRCVAVPAGSYPGPKGP